MVAPQDVAARLVWVLVAAGVVLFVEQRRRARRGGIFHAPAAPGFCSPSAAAPAGSDLPS